MIDTRQQMKIFGYTGSAADYVKFWLEPDNLIRLAGWRRNGCTMEDVATNIGVNVNTLRNWQRKHDKIREALTRTKEVADISVEGALYKRTQGYEVYEREYEPLIDLLNGDVFRDEFGQPKMVLKKEKVKLIPPDVTACLAWLYNRKSQEWQNNRIPETDAKAIMAASQIFVQIRRTAGVEDGTTTRSD